MDSAEFNMATSAIPLVFDPETLGKSFRELAVDVVEGETTAIFSRWFHSRHDADLFIWHDSEKRIIKHQLCLHGQVIEWNALDGTRTGVVIEEETTTEEECAEAIRFDAKAQADVVAQAVRVLGFVPDLTENDRKLLIHHLQTSPKMHKNARERALKAWAPKAHEISTDRRPTFWKRLRKWVLGD